MHKIKVSLVVRKGDGTELFRTQDFEQDLYNRNPMQVAREFLKEQLLRSSFNLPGHSDLKIDLGIKTTLDEPIERHWTLRARCFKEQCEVHEVGRVDTEYTGGKHLGEAIFDFLESRINL